MGLSIQMTKAFFESKGLRYRETDDGKALFVGFGGLKNKGDLEILLIFDDDDRAVAIRAVDVATAPENKHAELFRLCSNLNFKYRWVKFYVNKKRGAIAAEDDAVINPDSAGEEIFELILRMAGIVDQAYPEIMKALWT